MVGVGGRSGGCHTCRRRRVKCDEVHPKCNRCAKAKIPCEGYDRDLKFVDEKARAQKRVQVKRQAYLESIQAEQGKLKPSRRTIQLKTETQVPPNLSLAGSETTVRLTFMQNQLFSGWRMFIPWTMCEYRGQDNCTTTQAVDALSSMYFGRMHGDVNSVNAGVNSYSKALPLLGRDLKDPKAFTLSTLTNVLSLVIYEMFASSRGGMIQHLGGIQRLIEQCGPKRFQTRPSLDVFITARMGIMHHDMDVRRRCFLENPDWQTIPWLKEPNMKDLHIQICDQKCFIPGLLEDMEALRTGLRATPMDFQNLCASVTMHLRNLYNWRAAWEAQYPNCAYLVPNTDPDLPFSTAIHYTEMKRAVENCHYHTSLLALYRMARILYGPTFSSTSITADVPIIRTNPVLLLPSDSKTLQDIAHEFMRSIPYHLLEPHRHGGYFFLMFPLRSAFEVFREGSLEWRYCVKLFNEMAEKGGFLLARRLMPSGLRGRLMSDEAINT
ncbi:hypothetical protein HYFRA_00012672 [Hymenoscyphus fraxineus]|uniref:Zn(2)-C6 fungal-type domain-containing protein n=1 Tax=Hymenoscyphus fraxineus TaxID=746836 RepID=A0A9N9L938_9HELO|nr:hypothetical protein HYFRA_00012672 [Hymenoscyphus fraxineus]